jgi:hypothetical protein
VPHGYKTKLKLVEETRSLDRDDMTGFPEAETSLVKVVGEE